MAKQYDWLAINLLNDGKNFGYADLMAQNISPANTGLEDKDYYKNLKDIQEYFSDPTTGKFDEDAFNRTYESALHTYNDFAMGDYEQRLIAEVERHPYFWQEPASKVQHNVAIIDRSSDPYHRSMGLAGLGTIGKAAFSEREIAQTQEARNIDGVGLGWSPHDKAGLFSSLFLPTLAIAQYDKDGYYPDEDGNKVFHHKGERKLHNGEFYYELVGDRDIYDREVLRLSDNLTVEGTVLNKLDIFDSDSVNKSISSSLIRTAVEIVPYLIPQTRMIFGAVGAAMGISSSLPVILKSLDSFFTGSDDNNFGRSMQKWSNVMKRFDSTYSDASKKSFMSWEKLGTQIVDVAEQYYQQRYIGNIARLLGKTGTASEVGRNLSLMYMAATSGMDSYEAFKAAGASDRVAGIGTLATIAGFFGLMNNEYYKDLLFREDSFLNEDFVTRRTLQNIGITTKEKLGFDISGDITTNQAKTFFGAVYNGVKRNGKKAFSKLRDGMIKDKTLSSAEKAVVTEAKETAAAAAEKATEKAASAATAAASKGAKEASKKIKDAGTSWFMLMLNRSANEGIEELMEEVMQDIVKSVALGADSLGWDVREDSDIEVDFGFSPKDFVARYLTAGIGGFLGGSIFSGLEGWEFVNSPQLRRITDKGIKDEVRLAYLLRQGYYNDIIRQINKFEENGVFGSKELSAKGHARMNSNGEVESWDYDTVENESESQNSAVANALRAYVNYINNVQLEWGLNRSNKQLFEVLRLANEENKALYADSNIVSDKDRKRIRKEAKSLQEQGHSVSEMDLFEEYGFRDAVIVAMDKAGLFEDFYDDFTKLATRIAGAQFELDASRKEFDASHLSLTESERKAKWEETESYKNKKKNLDDLVKEKDAILEGDRNGFYVVRALYMANDVLNERVIGKDNRTLHDMLKEDSEPTSGEVWFDKSVENYAQITYGIHYEDMTDSQREFVKKEYEDYIQESDIYKKKNSFKTFLNFRTLADNSLRNIAQKYFNKSVNPYFGSVINVENASANINSLKRRLEILKERLADISIVSGELVAEKKKNWTVAQQELIPIAQRFGLLGNIEFVDPKDIENSTGKLTYVNGVPRIQISKALKDNQEIIKTFMHEAIGHYGLRGMVESVANTPIFMEALEKISGHAAKYTIDPNDSAWSQLLDVIYYAADDSVKGNIENLASAYNLMPEHFTGAKEGKTDEIYSIASSLYTEASNRFGNDEAQTQNHYNKLRRRLLTEEYLAKLAEDTKPMEENKTSSWLSRIWKFVKTLFGFYDNGKIEEKSVDAEKLKELIRIARDYTAKVATTDINALLSVEEAENLINTTRSSKHIYIEVSDDLESTAIFNQFYITFGDAIEPNPVGKEILMGEIDSPRKSIALKSQTDAIRSCDHTKFNTISDLLEALCFGKMESEEFGDTDLMTVNCPFIGLSKFNHSMEESGIDMVLINESGLDPVIVERIKSYLTQNFKISVFTFNEALDLSIDRTYRESLRGSESGRKYSAVVDPLQKRDDIVNEKILNGELQNVNGVLCMEVTDTIENVSVGNNSSVTIKYYFGTMIDGTPSTPESDTKIIMAVTSNNDVKALLGAGYKLIDKRGETFYLASEKMTSALSGITGSKISNNSSSILTQQAMSQVDVVQNANIELLKQQLNAEIELLTKQLIQAQKLSNFTQLAPTESGARIMDTVNTILHYLTAQTLDESIENPVSGEDVLSICDSILDRESEEITLSIFDITSLLLKYLDDCEKLNVVNINSDFILNTKNGLKVVLEDMLWRKLYLDRGLDESFLNKKGTDGKSVEETLKEAITWMVNDILDGLGPLEGIDTIANILVLEKNLEEEDSYKLYETFNQGVLSEVSSQFSEINRKTSTDVVIFNELLSLVGVSAGGLTTDLWSIINGSLNDAKRAASAEEFVIGTPGAVEALENIKLAYQMLDVLMVSAWGGNRGFSATMNYYMGTDLFTLDFEEDPELNLGKKMAILAQDEGRILSLVDYLLDLAKNSSEKQVKVQNDLAKVGHYRIIQGVVNSQNSGISSSEFHVNLKDLWDECGEFESNIDPATLDDNDYKKFFEQAKKFEHAVYEKFQDTSWQQLSASEKIDYFIQLFREGAVNTVAPGRLDPDKVEYNPISIINYLIAITSVDANEFYDELGKALQSLKKTPFYTQTLAIRYAHAFALDKANLYQTLISKLNLSKDITLENLFGINGSAGTGKTEVISNILNKMLSGDCNVLVGGLTDQLENLATKIGIEDGSKKIDVYKLLNEIAPGYDSIDNWTVDASGNTLVLKPDFVLSKSTTYDDRFSKENTVWIVDEATLINNGGWGAINKYAKLHNVKVIALGDLKQQGDNKVIVKGDDPITGAFLDFKILSSPLLTESLRNANKAKRLNTLIIGRRMDKAIDKIRETGKINNESYSLLTNFSGLFFKNIDENKFVGEVVVRNQSDFESKFEKLAKAEPDKTIAIISNKDYSRLKISPNITCITPKAVQGAEFDYCFIDVESEDSELSDATTMYTLITRSRIGSVIKANSSKLTLGNTSELEDGQLEYVSNSAQFEIYAKWMRPLLTSAESVEDSNIPTGQNIDEEDGSDSASRHRYVVRFSKAFNEDIEEFRDNPYIMDDLNKEAYDTIASNIVNSRLLITNKSVISNISSGPNMRRVVRIDIGNGNVIPFIEVYTQLGVTRFVPALVEGGELKENVELSNLEIMRAIGSALTVKFSDRSTTIPSITVNDASNGNIFVKNHQEVQQILDDFIEDQYLELMQGDYDELATARDNEARVEAVVRLKESYRTARKRDKHMSADDFYKFVNDEFIQSNYPIKSYMKNEDDASRKLSLRIISDLILNNARKVTGNSNSYVEIDPNMEGYIRGKLFDTFEDDSLVNAILGEVFSPKKKVLVEDTKISRTKLMNLVVDFNGEQVLIPISLIRGDTSTGYFSVGNFNTPFRGGYVTTFGRKRVSLDTLRKRTGISMSVPAILLGEKGGSNTYQSILDRVENSTGPIPEGIERLYKFVKRNKGKSMLVYSHVSYLDIEGESNASKIFSLLNPNSDSPYAYNNHFGKAMGIQRAVTLYELYGLSALLKYASEGYDEYLPLVQVFYDDVQTQADAISRLEREIGTNGGLEAYNPNLPSNSRAATRKSNRTKLVEKDIKLINNYTNEKIQTMMFLAASRLGESELGKLLTKVQAFTEKRAGYIGQGATTWKRSGYSFKLRDNTTFSGNHEIEYRLIFSGGVGIRAVWELYCNDGSGKWEKIDGKTGLLLTKGNLDSILNIIYEDLVNKGLSTYDSTDGASLLNSGHLSMSVNSVLFENNKVGEMNESPFFPLRISEFFVTLFTALDKAKPSDLFKLVEKAYDSLNADHPFRSGIFLESKSSGSSLSTDGVWFGDKTHSSDIGYTTDIIHIYKPIYSCTFEAIGENDDSCFKWRKDSSLEIPLRYYDDADAIIAKTREEFIAELNRRISDTSNTTPLDMADFKLPYLNDDGTMSEVVDIRSVKRAFGLGDDIELSPLMVGTARVAAQSNNGNIYIIGKGCKVILHNPELGLSEQTDQNTLNQIIVESVEKFANGEDVNATDIWEKYEKIIPFDDIMTISEWLTNKLKCNN